MVDMSPTAGCNVTSVEAFHRLDTQVNMATTPLLPPPPQLNQLPRTLKDSSEIVQFYKDKNVFLTGGSGFLGKAIIEKLLRVTDLAKIYVLLRPNKPTRGSESQSSSVATRLDDLLASPVFDGLRSQCPDTLSRVVAISGDVSAPECGMSGPDYERLCTQVHVVIHAAATIKFDEHLKIAMAVNVLGTAHVLDLCKRMEQLVSLVHVSTAYANCDRAKIDEVIYPENVHCVDPLQLNQAIQCFSDKMISSLTPQLMGTKPNTYTFTKALAEQLVAEECDSGRLKTPVALVRPSIVTQAVQEPMPGWIEPTASHARLGAAVGTGVLRTLYGHGDKKVDILPVDLVINLIIAAAWRTASSTRTRKITVYNCCSGLEICWNDIVRWGVRAWKRNPSIKMFWLPNLSLTSWKPWNILNDLIFHRLPAHIIDLIAQIVGKNPFAVKIGRMVRRSAEVLEYFRTHEWEFVMDNKNELMTALGPTDQSLFNCRKEDIDWPSYFETSCLGVRRYVLKHDPSSLPAARRKARIMRGAQTGLALLLAFCILLVLVVSFWNFYAQHL